MVGAIIANIIQTVVDIYLFVIFLSAALSFFLPPYHSLRVFLNKLVDPLLNPIRKAVPLVGNFDISPLILFILVQVGGSLLVRLIINLL